METADDIKPVSGREAQSHMFLNPTQRKRLKKKRTATSGKDDEDWSDLDSSASAMSDDSD